MDSPIKSKPSEATGVSRSGRVRKKSSKLTDFESPDEIDTRFKRRTDRPQKVVPPKPMSEDSDSFMDEEIIDVKEEPLEVEEWGEEPLEEEEGDEEEEEEEGVGGEEGGDGGLPEFSDPLQVDEDSTDVPRETSGYSQAQSLYFSEKQGKKSIVMKGGQVVVRRKKAQRKDKGKSRFTAYMLWAREVRPGIIQANPNMDFSAVNKRLGELWALVPTTQKYNWKRRAKRLAAKGNQKGGLISTGRPSRPPPTARANLINKGGVKPAPRPDPNPPAALPAPATQGSGHHRHSGQKVAKSWGKSCRPPESPAVAAAKRLDGYHSCYSAQPTFYISAPVLGKKQPGVNQRSAKVSPTTAGIPILGQKHPKIKEELDFYIQEKKQCEMKAKETKDAVGKRMELSVTQQGVRRGGSQCEGSDSWETESADSPEGSMLTDTVMIATVTDSSNSRISLQPSRTEYLNQPPVKTKNARLSIEDIFRDLFFDGYKCPFCPLSLAQALVSVVHKNLTAKKACILYCVSPSRLQTCISLISQLSKMLRKSKIYQDGLEEMRRYPFHEAVIEWLLRMRRMGRPPVLADVKQVSQYLSNKDQKPVGSLGSFLKVYGEPKMSQNEWAILSPWAICFWRKHFHEHVHVRCGLTPSELLISKNSPQVFTCAEALVSLGDMPKEVTIIRGRSNLYCLTRQNAGVSRAMLTFSAAGQFHPPTILQKGYELPHWALDEENIDLAASPDGRLDPLVFLGWLRLFEQRLTKANLPRPVVLFVHGNAAHASPAAESFCCAKGIILHSHHHSPINPMDPFMYLLSPLLHHLKRTQEQLISITGAKPLPDYLLPSILADAWSQVSEEKLASEVFERSGLVPYSDSKCFTAEKHIQIAAFPPVLLEPVKTYFPSGNLHEEVPFDCEPQICTTYHMRTLCLSKKSSDTVKEVQEESMLEAPPSTTLEDREPITNDNSDQTCDPLYIEGLPDQTCDPLYIGGPDPLSDSSIMESGRVVHIHNDLTVKKESPIAHSSENSLDGELDELPLSCEIQEAVSWSESWPNTLSTQQNIKTEPCLTFDPIHIELSKGDLPSSQPHVFSGYPKSEGNLSDLVSSKQDQLEVKGEIITPDKLGDDFWIKQEAVAPTGTWKFSSNSEEDKVMLSSCEEESVIAETVFIKEEPDES